MRVIRTIVARPEGEAKSHAKILPCPKNVLTLHLEMQRPSFRSVWKDAGAVERDGLENRCTLTGTQGSNPCLSANNKVKSAVS